MDLKRLMVVSFLFNATGHQMTACDCRKPSSMVVISFTRFSECDMPAKEIGQESSVAYTIFQHRHLSAKLDVFACKRWVTKTKVETFWDFSTDHQSISNVVLLAAEDCAKMTETSMCGQNNMLRMGRAWKFKGTAEHLGTTGKI